MFHVNDPGHEYEVHNVGEGTQHIAFIKKEEVDGEFKTIQEGTTNEAVIEVLIHRIKFLNEKMACRENSLAITKLEEALHWLNARTAERKARGVEGTHQA